MHDLVILGTDTDAGKTAFALLWLHAFGDQWDYWKPVETGESDTGTVQRLVPAAITHLPRVSLQAAVAPALAARWEKTSIPPAAQLATDLPSPAAPGRHLLIETFGSPLSPLNEDELQIEFICRLARPCVLVGSSKLGAVGRTLQCLQVLRAHHLRPWAVVLLGPHDTFAVGQILKYEPPPLCVVASLQLPGRWTVEAFRRAARKQRPELEQIARVLTQQVGRAHAPVQPRDWLAVDRRLVWHPYTSLRDPDSPLEIVAAQDEFLTLAAGRRIIDGISSWWTILHGHRHPVLVAALQEALKKYDHVHFAGATHQPAIELAELLLLSLAWREGGRVFYSDNGSTAVEVALKMAYQFWCHQGQSGRILFVGFENGYHGDTFGAMAASRDPTFFGTFEPLLFQVKIIPVSAEALEATLAQYPRQVAAVIIEPLLQAAGGMRLHSPQELQALRAVAQRHDVLFIADEVMTGCGRLGPLWAHREAGIEPDLLCTAKTLAGGVLSLGATVVSPQVVAAFDTADRQRTFFHGHSFTAHPLACAVAVANFHLLATLGPEPAKRLETVWQRALAELRLLPQVRDVRWRGSMAAVELNVPGGYLADVGRDLRQSCLEMDVLLRPLGNVFYTLPPLGTSGESLERIAEAMKVAVRKVGSIS